jgi:hypothetical protein
MRTSLLALVLALTTTICLPAQAAEDLRAAYALVRKQADSVVSLRFVMTVSAFGQENRQEMRTLGTLVTADGLILAPDGQVNPEVPERGSPGGDGGEAAPKVSVKTTEFKVLLPGREDWLPATMLTHDAGLGVAWLRLDQAPAKLPFVDLSRRGEAVMGAPYFVVARTGPDLGRAAMVAHGYLWGEVEVPRHAFLAGYPQGLAFTADGRVLGYVIPQNRGELRNADAADRTNALLLIPADKIASATRRALEMSQESGQSAPAPNL